MATLAWIGAGAVVLLVGRYVANHRTTRHRGARLHDLDRRVREYRRERTATQLDTDWR